MLMKKSQREIVCTNVLYIRKLRFESLPGIQITYSLKALNRMGVFYFISSVIGSLSQDEKF